VVWERTPRQEQPRAPSTKDGTWASSSAITDGRHVFAFFDSSGLYAYDMQGTQLWEKRFGDKKIFAEVGESGSTPVLYGNRLVVVWDHQGASFIVALNASTGPGALAHRAAGRRLLGDAARGGARWPRPGGHDRRQAGQELRP
jgi:outer membrane protein assembly factor BamB